MKSDICRQKIEKHLSQLIDDWRQLRRSTQDEETIFFSDSSSNGKEEEEEEDDVTEVRIARVFVKKRYLLNIINFIYDNEERIAQMNTKHIARLTELVQEETTEWMELLDYLQTIKNPRYLDNM
jgi:predicted HD phosphohydrolase